MSKKKILWMFLLLGFLLILPIAAPHILVKYGRGFLVQHQKRYGVLLEPPLNFEKFSFDEAGKTIQPSTLRGKWLIVYIHQDPVCSKACSDRLYSMRKIQLALGKEGERVVNWFITIGKPSITVDLKDLGIHHGQTSLRMLESFFNRSDAKEYAGKSGFYFVDPIGNLIMVYPQDENPNHLLKDLKRLLRASRIG